jgi:hypothetical protein
MNTVTTAAAGGGIAAAGLLLLVRHARPHPVPLDRLLAAPSRPAATAGGSPIGTGRTGRLARWLVAHPVGPAPPPADLAIMHTDPATLALRKAAMATLGLLLPPLTAAAITAGGTRIPFALPAGLGLLLAAVFYLAPDWILRAQAREARIVFSAAVGSYLDLVALERTADGAPAETLHRAAHVADSWPFQHSRTALDRARLAGQPPWHALSDLAEHLGTGDLRDLADILTAAGDDGAAVYTALTAKAASLRTRQLAAAKAAANTASERLTLPAVLLCFGFLLLVCYPGIARVLNL